MTSSSSPRRSLRRRARWLLAAGLFAAAATAVVVFALRARPRAPTPPGEDLDGLEPAVADLIHDARSRVLESPGSGRAWGILGEVFLANELEDDSVVCFAEAQRLEPKEPRWPYFRAGVLLNRGEREEAVNYLQQAVEHGDADETAPRLRLGEALLSLGRIDEAESCFRQVLGSEPANPRGHFDLGLVAVSRQEWQAARGRFERVVESPFARKKARVQLALVCRRLDEESRAARLTQQAQPLPADSDWPDSFVAEYQRWAVRKRSRYRRAESLEAAGRFDEAINAIQPLTEQYPDDYLPLLTLGKLLGEKGDPHRAEPILRQALRLAPDKAQTHYLLGLVLFMQGEALAANKSDLERSRAVYRESVQLARKALDLQPDYGFAYMSLGLSLKRLGQRSEAVAALRQAVRRLPDKAELHFYLGEALAEDGRPDEARARLGHALKIAEPNARWRRSAEGQLRGLPPLPDAEKAPKNKRDRQGVDGQP